MSVAKSPMGRIVPRRAEELVLGALADTRVVLVNGARQVGKSTLVGRIGVERGATLRTLDRGSVREAALADPFEFVNSEGLMLIDEVQRAPELLLAIKERVDRVARPGSYLLTGSARLLGLRSVPDLLPGRMETIELWPFSQGEIDGAPDGLIDRLFRDGDPVDHTSQLTKSDYVNRLVRGGFPEGVSRQGRRRERFFDAYVADLINRDVIQVSEIERGPEMRALTRVVAARSGQLLVPAAVGKALGLPYATTKRYLDLLEEVFLIKRIPAWSRNLSSRAVATPKVAVVDSGIAANLLGQDERGLMRTDSPLGGLLEGFVAMELARQATWARERVELFHHRTRDGVEVDLVLENRRGEVVAVDVKAASTVRRDDFRGIRHLQRRLADDLRWGIVLYTGDQTLSFGPRLRAMPISAIWEVGHGGRPGASRG